MSRLASRHARSARELFAAVPGVVVQDDPPSHDYPLATEAAGRDEIFVGRVRRDRLDRDDRGLAFWVVSDNLRKGAATNAVELAEVLHERGWIRPAGTRGATGRTERPKSDSMDSPRPRRDGRRAPVALEAIAAEVRACTNCRSPPDADPRGPGRRRSRDEVIFVGEGPGFNEDKQAGRSSVEPATCWSSCWRRSVGAARTSSSRTSSSAGRRQSRPVPDEIAACAPSCAGSSRSSIRP
jgi:hypothetical protein